MAAVRRTKIVATLGPATEGEHQIKDLVHAGMDAARINFSHGDHAQHARIIAAVRSVSREMGRHIAVIADLQGPKTRVGEMPPAGLKLIRGRQILLTARRLTGDDETIPVSYQGLGSMVKAGSRILLDDGRISLKVIEAQPDGDVVCRVTAGGVLKSRKGLNVPGESLAGPAITSKDKQDLEFALQTGVDYVALSFVRSSRDVRELASLIDAAGGRPAKIIAKIEKQEAIRRIGEVIEAADAIMIARGDLGVEIAPEKVPYWQKEIIRRCIASAKPVITATEMLESMIERPVPTRAEASDVANAVYDGSDALMLSGETAIGKFPAKSVDTMHRIARTVESSLVTGDARRLDFGNSITGAISAAACELAEGLGADALVTPTSSGSTALQVSSHRPDVPVIAICPDADLANQLSLAWGIQPYIIPPARDTDDMFERSIDAALKSGLVRSGSIIVITAGVLVNVPGTTNLIKVHRLD